MKITTLCTGNHKNGIITKFIKTQKLTVTHKFKLQYECTNGTSRLSAQIMTSDGDFKYVLTKEDVGEKFKFVASYVSDFTEKSKDAEKGFKILEDMITKIYS